MLTDAEQLVLEFADGPKPMTSTPGRRSRAEVAGRDLLTPAERGLAERYRQIYPWLVDAPHPSLKTRRIAEFW